MDMHRTARLVFHRLGKEGGVDTMPQRRFTHGALEQKHLVGARHRIGMHEVHFELCGARFVNQGVHVQFHFFGVVVHQIENRIEFIHGIDRIRLSCGFRPARATCRRLQRKVRIGIFLYQKEFQLRRHNRLHALGFVQGENIAQHIPWRQFMRLAVSGKTVMNHLRGGVRCPGHHPHGIGIGAQVHV